MINLNKYSPHYQTKSFDLQTTLSANPSPRTSCNTNKFAKVGLSPKDSDIHRSSPFSAISNIDYTSSTETGKAEGIVQEDNDNFASMVSQMLIGQSTDFKSKGTKDFKKTAAAASPLTKS